MGSHKICAIFPLSAFRERRPEKIHKFRYDSGPDYGTIRYQTDPLRHSYRGVTNFRMKKTALFLLCAALVLTLAACSSSSPEDDAAEEESIVQPEQSVTEPEDDAAETEAPPQLEFPEDAHYTSTTDLRLAKTPEYRDGKLILYFTEKDLWYKPETICSIGLISSDSAQSVPATLDMTSFPDMFDGDDYCGAALVPSSPLPAGSYTFSVSIAEYLVTFDMDID